MKYYLLYLLLTAIPLHVHIKVRQLASRQLLCIPEARTFVGEEAEVKVDRYTARALRDRLPRHPLPRLHADAQQQANPQPKRRRASAPYRYCFINGLSRVIHTKVSLSCLVR
jgi:hypothetical protein